MTATTEKLGLFLPQGLHEQMVQAAAERLSGRKTPRGGVRLVYEQAFNDLLEALDAGQLVAFPAVRGAGKLRDHSLDLRRHRANLTPSTSMSSRSGVAMVFPLYTMGVMT